MILTDIQRVVPKGYKSILTKEQWDGVLDFVKEVDAKRLI